MCLIYEIACNVALWRARGRNVKYSRVYRGVDHNLKRVRFIKLVALHKSFRVHWTQFSYLASQLVGRSRTAKPIEFLWFLSKWPHKNSNRNFRHKNKEAALLTCHKIKYYLWFNMVRKSSVTNLHVRPGHKFHSTPDKYGIEFDSIWAKYIENWI